MADKLGVDAALAVEGLFEGEDDQHLGDPLLDPAKAPALPGPELRRDEPDDRDAGAVKVVREAEVHIREVDEHSDRGTVSADGADETAVTGIDVRDVAEDFGDAHDGDVFGADNLPLMMTGHLNTAEASEGGVGKTGAEGGDDLGAVGVA